MTSKGGTALGVLSIVINKFFNELATRDSGTKEEEAEEGANSLSAWWTSGIARMAWSVELR